MRAENSRNCPDEQYDGTVVNGVELNVLIGAYHFPDDEEFSALVQSARATLAQSAFSGADFVRPMAWIRMSGWRNEDRIEDVVGEGEEGRRWYKSHKQAKKSKTASAPNWVAKPDDRRA